MPGERTRHAALTQREPIWVEDLRGDRRKAIDWPEPLETIVRQSTPDMDRHIARARRDMGEERWAELKAEWPQEQAR